MELSPTDWIAAVGGGAALASAIVAIVQASRAAKSQKAAADSQRAAQALHESVAADLKAMARVSREQLERMDQNARRQEAVHLYESRRRALKKLAKFINTTLLSGRFPTKLDLADAWLLEASLFSASVARLAADLFRLVDEGNAGARPAGILTTDAKKRKDERLEQFSLLTRELYMKAAGELSPFLGDVPPPETPPNEPTAN